MKRIKAGLLCLLLAVATTQLAFGKVHVPAYYRKDGTYVHSYDRSEPGSSSAGGGAYGASRAAGTNESSSTFEPSSIRFIPAPDPSRDPNWVPAKIISGQCVPGHYKQQELAGSTSPVATASPTARAAQRQLPSSYGFQVSRPASIHTIARPTKRRSVRPASHHSYTGRYRTEDLTGQPSSAAFGVQRDAHGRIKRSESAKRAFMRITGYSRGRPGYVVDHIIPLKRGGADDPSNMQWQTVEEAKAKDKVE